MKLSSLFRRATSPTRLGLSEVSGESFPPPLPDETICLLGDLHGRLDCLEQFLLLRQRHFPSATLIVLGDMIDRGPDSAGVLARLQDATTGGAICLKGNHEEMLLAAIANPEDNLSTWLRHGGRQAAASFGIDEYVLEQLPAVEAAALLREQIGAATLDWLSGLPLNYRSGNVVAVHAGLDPAHPLACQAAKTMLWGHPSFAHQPRRDGLWVVYGHTIVERASKKPGKIALDTGAYATGKLSYALIDPALPEHERVMIGLINSLVKS
ncbi:metallophosphoesterase [Paracoccus benzoatiresistens]|uniref:Metallophosphoesterase n=1 Tax=Paracoccus benzoatiresistens TaxID=2997341 RepID=A0ABT4JBA3_9RHOB|nr:metallophosphoesterase [Paracoccus sp. EF6]MCZ0964364.1 metallophosphoesterase [Paracoccus sp. EF6]